MIGRLDGFTFAPDAAEAGSDAKALQATAQKALAGEIDTRAEKCAAAPDDQFVLTSDGTLRWTGDAVAKLVAADDALHPRIRIISDDRLNGAAREAVQTRLDLWLKTHIEKLLGPLFDLTKAEDITGIARGIAFQLIEALGVLERAKISAEMKDLDQPSRAGLRKYGVRFGAYHIYVPPLFKPAARALASLLWAQKQDNVDLSALSGAQHLAGSGRTSFPVDKTLPRDAYRVLGYKQCGERAVRVDILERLADLIRPALSWRETSPGEKPAGAFDGRGFVVTQAMTSLTGSAGEDFASILRALGYRSEKRAALPPKPVVVEAAPVEATPAETAVAEITPAEPASAEEAVLSMLAASEAATSEPAARSIAQEPVAAAPTDDAAGVTHDTPAVEEATAPSAAMLPEVAFAPPAEQPAQVETEAVGTEAVEAEAAEAKPVEAEPPEAAPVEAKTLRICAGIRSLPPKPRPSRRRRIRPTPKPDLLKPNLLKPSLLKQRQLRPSPLRPRFRKWSKSGGPVDVRTIAVPVTIATAIGIRAISPPRRTARKPPLQAKPAPVKSASTIGVAAATMIFANPAPTRLRSPPRPRRKVRPRLPKCGKMNARSSVPTSAMTVAVALARVLRARTARRATAPTNSRGIVTGIGTTKAAIATRIAADAISVAATRADATSATAARRIASGRPAPRRANAIARSIPIRRSPNWPRSRNN